MPVPRYCHLVAQLHDGAGVMTSFFRDLLVAIGERGRNLVDLQQASPQSKDLPAIAKALLSQKGEASGIALADDFFSLYEKLETAELDHFFNILAEQFGPDIDSVRKIIGELGDHPTAEAVLELHKKAEPQRQELFRRLNQVPEGTLKLVRLREDLLERLDKNPRLAEVDADLHHLFHSWFNRGFLVLKRITWSTPASVLEKIIKYEAVHEIASWEELRQRIEPADRRCYAFFHPVLVEEPLIFVEVALGDEMPDAIEPVIARKRETIKDSDARLATFYSISNCQQGLSGISFGSFLIKQVARELLRELPQLKSFVTLSPVPGFKSWLLKLVKNKKYTEQGTAPILTPETIGVIKDFLANGWSGATGKQQTLEKNLLPLSAWYFLNAKDRFNKPYDFVARFHLGNGARLERINWLADRSAKSFEQSAGIMVNYLYDLDDIEKNHEAFANDDRVITASIISRMAKYNSSSSQILEETS
ncbi:MAG: malonyl-CoA decarboxylase [bacterium]|nr:malonyl-CoA decarboxylase [bacterium]